MAEFNGHLAQARKNIDLFKKINQMPDTYDWQVTIIFYAALHLANAHIVKTVNLHHRSHGKTGAALNPYITTNPSAFDEKAYLAYLGLLGLSRRARYLCSEDDGDKNDRTHHISEKHLAKAIRYLNEIIKYFSVTHEHKFDKVVIKCERIKSDKLDFFGSVN